MPGTGVPRRAWPTFNAAAPAKPSDRRRPALPSEQTPRRPERPHCDAASTSPRRAPTASPSCRARTARARSRFACAGTRDAARSLLLGWSFSRWAFRRVHDNGVPHVMRRPADPNGICDCKPPVGPKGVMRPEGRGQAAQWSAVRSRMHGHLQSRFDRDGRGTVMGGWLLLATLRPSCEAAVL